MNKNFYILSTLQDGINMGDVTRVMEFFKNKPHKVVTFKKYNKFFKELNKKNVIDIKKFNLKKNTKNIVNLVVDKNISNCFWDINNNFFGKYNKKNHNLKILKTLSKKINFPISLHKKPKKNLKIGFNNIVPNEWKIKEYPKKNWQNLKNKLNELPNVNVQFQPKLKLIPYLKWIKSCDVFVSIVGFGVHVASYFDKKIVMLSGPTDRIDYRKKDRIKTIYPKKRCVIHKKKLYLKNKNCSCMKNIDENEVFKAVKSYI